MVGDVLGSSDGLSLGEGDVDGVIEGEGLLEGDSLGVGTTLGVAVGLTVGAAGTLNDGVAVGFCLGSICRLWCSSPAVSAEVEAIGVTVGTVTRTVPVAVACVS